MDITLHQFRAFREVARYGQFTRAAEALFISQPAVSKTVKDLERQVGAPLFEAIGRRVQLTQAGRLLLPYVERVLVEIDDAQRAIRGHHAGEQGRLIIGASHTPGTYILPRFLGEFHQRYPLVNLALEVGSTSQILENLCAGQLDLAIVGEAAFDSTLIVEVLCRERLVLILSPQHPLASRRPLTTADLSDEPLVIREKGSSTREITDRAFQDADFKPIVCMELGSTEAVKKMVATGICASFVSVHELDLELRYGVLAARSVDGLNLDRGIFLARRASFQPTIVYDRFVQVLRETAENSCPSLDEY